MLLDFVHLLEGKTLYNTLYTSIRDAVEKGIIKKGEKLPSLRQAAAQLGVSRTTVENAYLRLCIEGIAEGLPQRGYFICDSIKIRKPAANESSTLSNEIKYDFSTQQIDTEASDEVVWKKLIRRVLNMPQQLTSYGEAQGESGLRQALSEYSYKARGVQTTPENIVVGAGIGPLLNILCGLLGNEITVGIENGGFSLAQNIFSDHKISSVLLPSDKNGATINGLTQSGVDVLFLMPSSLEKISVTSLSKRRNDYLEWASNKENRLVIEDDYNGELRYTARAVTAFQAKAWEKTVYIGSFSKLLLPSVRIAYMVLPDFLAVRFKQRQSFYNQTCGKIEQSALCEYINSGGLEKHLRTLRRLYYEKSRLLCKELYKKIPNVQDILLYETSLIAEVLTDLDIESKRLCELLRENSIRVIESEKKGGIKLCFAGISKNDIPDAVEILANIIKEKINS